MAKDKPKLTKEETIEKFWSKVNKIDDDDSCWEWQGAVNDSGYGQFFNNLMNTTMAHRFSYTMNIEEILPGNVICHKCDNPPCIRPDHLFQGTHTDNMQDAIDKGRMTYMFATGLKGQNKTKAKSKSAVRKDEKIAKLEQELKDLAADFIKLEGQKIKTITKQCDCQLRYEPPVIINKIVENVTVHKTYTVKCDCKKKAITQSERDRMIDNLIDSSQFDNKIILSEKETARYSKNMCYLMESCIRDILSKKPYTVKDIKDKLSEVLLKTETIKHENYLKGGR